MARKNKKGGECTKGFKKSPTPIAPSKRKSARLSHRGMNNFEKVKQLSKNNASSPTKTGNDKVRKVGNMRRNRKTDNLVTIIDENVLNEDFIPLSSTDVGRKREELLKCSKVTVNETASCNIELLHETEPPTIVIDDDEEKDVGADLTRESVINDSVQIICDNESTNSKKRKHDESIEICFEASDGNNRIAKKPKVLPSCSKDVIFKTSNVILEDKEVFCCENVDGGSDDEIVVIESPKSKSSCTILKDIPQQNNSVYFGKKKEQKKRHNNFVKEAVTKPTHSYVLEDSQSTSNNKSATYKSPLARSSAESSSTESLFNKTGSNIYYQSYFNKTGNNIYNPNDVKKTGLRPVIIDGSNVAYGHGGNVFSIRGVEICLDYFVKRGHMVRAFVPRYWRNEIPDSDRKILDELHRKQLLSFTPSRYLHGRRIASYDDRFIVQCAAELGGVIVSTDNYRDLLGENESWRETIEKRLLMFTWVGDILMFPEDPNGRKGPRLEEFLRFPE